MKILMSVPNISEGRNREVRRVLAKMGHKVRELTRTRFGPLSLGTLKPGQSRFLFPRELRDLRAAVDQAGSKPVQDAGLSHL